MRCAWAETDELLKAYHDEEWGVPVHDDQRLFAMLNLEGAQAGLSWLTVLRKRAHYEKAFDHFQPRKIIHYDARRCAELMRNEGIVRNRLKIRAVIENAKAFLRLREEVGRFDRYLWSFADGRTILRPSPTRAAALSERMSRDLRARGFRFVGPTICYAFMQAVGLVNDHVPSCFRAALGKDKPKRKK